MSHRGSLLVGHRSARARRRGVRSCLVIVAAAVLTSVTFAQPGDRSQFLDGLAPLAHPNFDIRAYKGDPAWQGHGAAAEYLAKYDTPAVALQDLAVSRVTGVAQLEAAYPGVKVENSPTTRSTRAGDGARTGIPHGPVQRSRPDAA